MPPFQSASVHLYSADSSCSRTVLLFGKTDYLVVEAARQVNIPEYRGLILRRAVPDLARIIDQTRAIYPSIDRGARYNATTRVWTFSSDAQIKLGSLFRTNEKYKYQGQQYDFIGFDELTQFTFDEYSYLKSRNRGNCKATKVYMRSTLFSVWAEESI